MAKKKANVRVGDIFAIRIGKNMYSYGQVVAQGTTSDSMIIYDIISDEHPSVEEIIGRQIVFFINTVDVEIEDGKWVIVGNAQIPKHLVFPQYITETLEGYKVLSHKGEVLGIANEYQIKELKPVTSYSPIILEDAVKAKYGYEDWYAELDNIVYKL
ncbi:MAG: Imm26 family immunity protein [Bacillota bacterium]|nr:Imm26 family immunity protein [Bacillota bacterium]